MFIFLWIIIGLIAGWVTGTIMQRTGYGTVGDSILGTVGAVIGCFIMRTGSSAGVSLTNTVLVAIWSAAVPTALVRAIKKA